MEIRGYLENTRLNAVSAGRPSESEISRAQVTEQDAVGVRHQSSRLVPIWLTTAGSR